MEREQLDITLWGPAGHDAFATPLTRPLPGHLRPTAWGMRWAPRCLATLFFGHYPRQISVVSGQEDLVIIVGLALLIAGFLLKIAVLWTLGIIILVIGLVLMLLGGMGRAVGGRRHYY